MAFVRCEGPRFMIRGLAGLVLSALELFVSDRGIPEVYGEADSWAGGTP